MAIESSVCPSCGTGITAEHQFCQQCGAQLRGSAKPGFTSGSRIPLVIPSTVWRRAVPPFVTLIGAFLPWLTFSTGGLFGGGVSRSISLVSAGFTGWLAVLVLAAAVAVGAWPLWRTTEWPGWVPRVWLAVGAACLGGGPGDVRDVILPGAVDWRRGWRVWRSLTCTGGGRGRAVCAGVLGVDGRGGTAHLGLTRSSTVLPRERTLGFTGCRVDQGL